MCTENFVSKSENHLLIFKLFKIFIFNIEIIQYVSFLPFLFVFNIFPFQLKFHIEIRDAADLKVFHRQNPKTVNGILKLFRFSFESIDLHGSKFRCSLYRFPFLISLPPFTQNCIQK